MNEEVGTDQHSDLVRGKIERFQPLLAAGLDWLLPQMATSKLVIKAAK